MNLKNEHEDFYIEGIDVKSGIGRFAGKTDRYKKSLLKFAEQYLNFEFPESEDEIKPCLHSIKGVSANLGINDLYLAFTEAEKVETPDFETLKKDLIAICYKIKTVLGQSIETEVQITQSGNLEEYRELISNLKIALKQSNPTASEKICKKLQSCKWGDSVQQNFKPIAQAIDDYDFDAALNLLDN